MRLFGDFRACASAMPLSISASQSSSEDSDYGALAHSDANQSDPAGMGEPAPNRFEGLEVEDYDHESALALQHIENEQQGVGASSSAAVDTVVQAVPTPNNVPPPSPVHYTLSDVHVYNASQPLPPDAPPPPTPPSCSPPLSTQIDRLQSKLSATNESLLIERETNESH